jgi:hypothetical protein
MVLAATRDRVVAVDALTGTVQPCQLIQLKTLVGAAPVTSQGFAYVVGLGGGIRCLALRLAVSAVGRPDRQSAAAAQQSAGQN